MLCKLQVMDELCSNKPWSEPLAVAGSSVETGISEDEKENGKGIKSKQIFYL